MQAHIKNNAVIVSFVVDLVRPNEMSEAFAKALAEVDKGQTFDWILLNLSKCGSMSSGAIPVIARSVGEASQRDLKFGIIAGDKISKMITSQGIDSLLTLFSSEDEFVEKTAKVKKDEVAVFLNTMLESTQHTMKISLECDVKGLPPKICNGGEGLPTIQVGAMAGIISSHFNGNMMVGFDKDSFLKAMSRFLQMEVTEITPEIKDGAAELLNVIVGQTKIKLNEKGFEIKQVIPSVITGEKVDVSPMSKVSTVVIPYEAVFGKFYIMLTSQKPMA